MVIKMLREVRAMLKTCKHRPYLLVGLACVQFQLKTALLDHLISALMELNGGDVILYKGRGSSLDIAPLTKLQS